MHRSQPNFFTCQTRDIEGADKNNYLSQPNCVPPPHSEKKNLGPPEKVNVPLFLGKMQKRDPHKHFERFWGWNLDGPTIHNAILLKTQPLYLNMRGLEAPCLYVRRLGATLPLFYPLGESLKSLLTINFWCCPRTAAYKTGKWI